VFNYFTATYDGTLNPSLTQLGTANLTDATTTIFNSTAPLTIPNGIWWGGSVLYAEVRSPIGGTIVAAGDFRSSKATDKSVVGTNGTWTLLGNAMIQAESANQNDRWRPG
jgi:hypothetical protein